MKREKAAIILVISCFYFFSLFIMELFAAGATKTAAGLSENQPKADQVQRPKEEFNAEGLRDPFRDYFGGPGEQIGQEQGEVSKEPVLPPPVLTVQGVISGGRLNQAIINNKIVKVGDVIAGASITNIDKQGITIFFGNKSYYISSPAAGTLQSLKKTPKGGNDEK